LGSNPFFQHLYIQTDEITTIIPAFAGTRDSFGDYFVCP
jgi:hypothetical protein